MNFQDWPGNMRELEDRVHRAIAMCDHRWITPADLGLDKHRVGAGQLSLRAARGQAEKQAIELGARPQPISGRADRAQPRHLARDPLPAAEEARPVVGCSCYGLGNKNVPVARWSGVHRTPGANTAASREIGKT
ncbi:MAG: hypothetical protein ACREBC_14920 [Pyrinomonadaceae bacterium]